MTDKEKMLAGLPYNPFGSGQLVEERATCKEKCHDYNNLRPKEMLLRDELLRGLLGSVKGDLLIEQPFNCDYGYNIKVGHNFYANFNLVILDEAPVTFGDNVFIAPNCSFYTACHPIDPKTRNTGLEYAKPITVGNNVWIGGSVTVLPGITIGDNCVIGAGSVVVNDIPTDSVAVGNPCRVIKKVEKADR